MSRQWHRLVLAAGIGVCIGCAHVNPGNNGQMQSYTPPMIEAGWIREGKPIEFDGHQWYPVKDIESLLDSEVYQVGEYKDVPIFVEKVDTKPYDRIYTKFAKDKFRYFERQSHD